MIPSCQRASTLEFHPIVPWHFRTSNRLNINEQTQIWLNMKRRAPKVVRCNFTAIGFHLPEKSTIYYGKCRRTLFIHSSHVLDAVKWNAVALKDLIWKSGQFMKIAARNCWFPNRRCRERLSAKAILGFVGCMVPSTNAILSNWIRGLIWNLCFKLTTFLY